MNKFNVDLFGWFPKDCQELLARLIDTHNIKSVIEIGSFLGASTIFFAQRCEKVFAIDPFVKTEEPYMDDPEVTRRLPTLYEQFLYNLDASGVRKKVTVLRMTSEEAAEQKISADMVYIDGSHVYEDVKLDISLWYPRANIIICGDDYTDMFESVRRAVDEAAFPAIKNQRIWYYIKK